MFQLWGKIFKDNRMIKDLTISHDPTDTPEYVQPRCFISKISRL